MLCFAVVHSRDSISSLVDGREEVSLYIGPMGITAYLLRVAGSVRCVDRSGFRRHRVAAHVAPLKG